MTWIHDDSQPLQEQKSQVPWKTISMNSMFQGQGPTYRHVLDYWPKWKYLQCLLTAESNVFLTKCNIRIIFNLDDNDFVLFLQESTLTPSC